MGESTIERLHREPGAAQRELRRQDESLYVERATPLGLGQVQPLPVPGRLDLGDTELELHPAEGHTSDGTALFAPFCGVLACGDYLSGVEIPTISSGGTLEEYRATLARLAPLVERAETVVPGHGAPRAATTPCAYSTRTWSTWMPWNAAMSRCHRGATRCASASCTRRIWAECRVSSRSTGTKSTVEPLPPDYLMTAIVSPVATEPPSDTPSSSTVPPTGAVISFSIFMASITHTSAPSST